MDDKLPNSAQNHREDSFDTAVRGFNRQQVLEYMSRSSQLLASLEQNLAVARADIQRARSETERAEAEAERLRTAQAEAKPVHEEVSGRLSQILRLAAEEADQDRANANEEITKLRLESKAESERLINEARAEAERELAEARDTAEQELAQARETAERELAEARANAEEDLRFAREEAERIRVTSEAQSTELLDDAARRASAVNEVSDQRLDTLTATHGEAVLRLGQIRDVLADLLDRDAAAGSLADVVEAVISPPPAPREIDTPAELEDGIDPEQVSVDQEQVSVDQEQVPEQTSVDHDQTSIVPAVAQTAVHPAVDAELLSADENVGSADEPAVDAEPQAASRPGRIQGNPYSETAEHEIDLRDQEAKADRRGVPTR